MVAGWFALFKNKCKNVETNVTANVTTKKNANATWTLAYDLSSNDLGPVTLQIFAIIQPT